MTRVRPQRRKTSRETTSVTPFDQEPKTRKAELLELCARIGFTPPSPV